MTEPPDPPPASAELPASAARPSPSAAKPGAVAEEERRPWWVPPFWQMPPWELESQLEEYGTMAWHRSYRKISVLLVVFVVLVVLSVGAFGPPRLHSASGGLVVVGLLYLGLAAFVYRGSRAALVALMIFWTLDRASVLVTNIWNPLAWAVSFAWWMFSMERFYRAWCIENARHAARRASA